MASVEGFHEELLTQVWKQVMKVVVASETVVRPRRRTTKGRRKAAEDMVRLR